MLPDLGKDLLHKDELVRHKREVLCKLSSAVVSFDVQDGIGEGEEVSQDRIVGIIYLF